jgi:hypothetical protein
MLEELSAYELRVLKLTRQKRIQRIEQNRESWSYPLRPVGKTELIVSKKMLARKTIDILSGDTEIVLEPIFKKEN